MPTATPFNNLITFSRGSNATVTGSNGLIQWAPNNLLTFSEQFDNSAWQKFGGGVATAPAVTANAGVAPDGTTTADRVQFTLNGGTTSTDRSLLSQSATLATSFPYTYSIWVRSLTGTLSMGIGCDNLVGNTPITVTTEWQRFTVSGIATGTAGVALLQLRGGQTPVQSNAADVLVWGAQLELGSTATTYNPTTVKNLLGFSEAFDNAAWTKVAASIVTGAQANPVNGLFNAQKFMEDTTNAEHIVRVNIALSTITGTPYGYSVYAKAAGRTQIRVTDNNVVGATFTLTGTGATSNISGGVTASISPLADGWYRCFISVAAASVNGRLALNLVSSGNTTYTGDGNSGVYIYGAQLSDSASLDPYVPTPGAAPSSTAFYGPRFDYDPVTRAPRGLLVEEQRTNLVTYSDQFNDASWAKNNVTVTTNTTTSPDGTVNADTITSTSATTAGLVRSFASTAVAYTFSVYLKQGNTTFSEIEIIDQGTVANRVRLTYATGALTVVSGSPTGTATSVGNGWWRVTIAYTFPAIGAADTLVIYPSTTTGSIGEYCFAWAAQLEAGAFATSYIPTIASTVTRSADVALISGQNFAQWYGQPEGTFVIDYRQGEGTTARSAAVANDGTNNNTIELYIDGSTDATTLPFYGVYVGGAVQAALSFAAAAANSNHKMAGAYRTNDFAASVDGSSVATDTSGTLPTPTRLSIGANGPATGSFANGHIRNIRFIPARAADFQLQALSTQPIVDYFFLQTATGDQLVDGSGDYLYSLPIFG